MASLSPTPVVFVKNDIKNACYIPIELSSKICLAYSRPPRDVLDRRCVVLGPCDAAPERAVVVFGTVVQSGYDLSSPSVMAVYDVPTVANFGQFRISSSDEYYSVS